MAGEFTKISVMLQLWSLVNIIVQACDPPCLYFSAGRTIKSIELSSKKITSNVTVPQAHDGRVLAVAVDVEEKILYWSDQVSRTIKRIHLQSGKIEVVASEVGHCEGIAIEWVNKYIYWTDNKNGRIEMSRVNGSDRRVLFDRDVQNPRGITVDPVHGYIFWTDYGDDPKIERATLAGQERTTIIANSISSRLKYPNDVIVDYTDNKIYWVDAGLDVVGTANLDGHNVKISEPIKNSHLFAVALHNNTLYITDSEINAKSIRLIDKESLKEIGRFTSSMIGSRDLLGITMLHESRQPPVISRCSHGNGGCSHLCFIVPNGYRCGCPNGTALREDGYSCQEANFTNCRNQPCQNGGTCHFNFHSFSDDCTCSKYYVGKDCGLYLGSGAVRITLEMKVKEWEEEKFKQAIKRGLHDYCMGDHCSLRLNKTISKQFCHTFLNGSAFDASQVTIIGKPTAPLPNHTKVDFAVILRAVSSSKPVVVVNTTLEHIVRARVCSISKHLGGYETVFVNNLRPVCCNNKEDVDDKLTNNKKKWKKNRSFALAIGTTISVIIVLVLVIIAAVWHRRRRDNEQRVRGGINEEGNRGGYEFIEENVPRRRVSQRSRGGYGDMQRGDINEGGNHGEYEFIEGNVPERRVSQRSREGYEDMQRGGTNEEGNHGDYENIAEQNVPERGDNQRLVEEYENMQRGGINEEGNHEEIDFIEQNDIRAPGPSHSNILDKKNFNNTQVLFRRKQLNDGMKNRDTVDNQERETYHEYVNESFRENAENEENEVAQKNGNQQSERAYEDMSASRSQAAQLQSGTPRNVDQRDASTGQGKQTHMLGGLETGRQAVENDDHPVQCTEGQEKNQH